MSAPDWPARWLRRLPRKAASLWRGVEAQHVAATMKLIDSAAEQSTLESLLEASKPPPPAEAGPGTHYLLFTPFRYLSPFASRFRPPHAPGVWYGAEALPTACAEVGYWRWRFLTDSAGLAGQALLTEHTFFEARVDGRVADLGAPRWRPFDPVLMHPTDYAACHRLAEQARAAGADWIRYRSARDPAHGACGAVLALAALSMGDLTRQQTWLCKATAASVLLRPMAPLSAAAPVELRFA